MHGTPVWREVEEPRNCPGVKTGQALVRKPQCLVLQRDELPRCTWLRSFQRSQWDSRRAGSVKLVGQKQDDFLEAKGAILEDPHCFSDSSGVWEIPFQSRALYYVFVETGGTLKKV